MKTIAAIFGAALAGLVLIIYLDNRQTFADGTAHVVAATVQFWQLLLWSVLFVIVLAAIVAAYIGISIYRQRIDMYSRDRARDGSFALREYRVRRQWWNPFSSGVTILVDPNLMDGAAAIIGDHGYTESPPMRDAPRIEVQRTRHLQAMTPGDTAISSPNGSLYRPTRGAMNESTRKLLGGAPSQPAQPRTIEAQRTEQPVTPVTMYGAGDLQTRNTATAMVIGQSPEDGNLATWNVIEQPHIRLHGSSQGGKSSLARYIAVSALVQGWRVIVLDRRRFKDWSMLGGYAELCDVSHPRALADSLKHLHAEYRERDQLLGKNGAPNIAALPERLRPVRTMVVVEEFGVQLVNAKADGVAGVVLNSLRPIAAEAGAAGLHLMMVDQLPVDWDRAIKANVSAVVTFRQPEHSGQAAGYWAAHQLQPYHFAFDGVEYKAPYIAPDKMRPGLQNMGIVPPPPLMASVHGGVREGVRDGVRQEVEGGGVPTTNTTNTPAEGSNETAARQWIDRNPEGGVNALARYLAGINGRPDDWRNFQSEASKWKRAHAPTPATTDAKAAAARENGKRGGRPRKQK